ncbi:MAG: ROK family protein [Acidobacteria bacterium]|nr:ROK family protein [Acidobacteriota bacterium]
MFRDEHDFKRPPFNRARSNRCFPGVGHRPHQDLRWYRQCGGRSSATCDGAHEIPQGSARVIANASKLARALLQSHQQVSLFPVLALGVGSVGQIDYASGRVVVAPAALPGWPGTCLKSALGTELGLPTSVEIDANAAADGEYRAGAAHGHHHVVCLTLGAGIGGGVIAEPTVAAWCHRRRPAVLCGKPDGIASLRHCIGVVWSAESHGIRYL